MKETNMGCFVVPLIVAILIGIYLLSTYVPKELQLVVGLAFAAIIVGVIFFVRIKHGRPLGQ